MFAAWPAHAERPPTIMVLGDSLSAAFGMDRDDGWVALLRERLEAQGHPHRVVNASISGETTAGGLRRLPKLLERHTPDLVVLELGANDGLRALSLKTMRNNLRQIITRSRAAGAEVLLLGMRIPSNYGPAYTDKFRAVFSELAEAESVALVPFFLAPIALQPDYFQADRIHPNARAQPLLLDQVWGEIERLIAPKSASLGNIDNRPHITLFYP